MFLMYLFKLFLLKNLFLLILKTNNIYLLKSVFLNIYFKIIYLSLGKPIHN